MIDALATDLVFQPLRFSRNRLEVMIDPADTTLTDRSDLRYALTLLVPAYPQSTVLEELTTLVGRERPPQMVAGVQRFDGAQFRIDEVLDGFLDVQKPAFGQNRLGMIPTLTMPYSRRETITGGTPAVHLTTERPREWVFKGGLTNEDFASWGDRFFDRHLRDTRQFLTWQPAEKSVTLEAEEYLYFLLNFSPTPAQVRLRVEVNYSDNYSQEFTVLTLDRPALNAVICCPVGPTALGLINLTGGRPLASVLYYTVWLSREDDRRLSEVRTYKVCHTQPAQVRYLLLANSLGGFDTLRLLGQGEETTMAKRTMVETDAYGATAIDFASLRVVDVQGDTTLTVSTGYFSSQAATWLRYLSELLLSRQMYLQTIKGHVPLLLTTTELVTHEDDPDLISRTLTFSQTKPEVNYSQMPITPPEPARATAWRGVGFRHILDSNGFRTGLGAPLRLRQYYTDTKTDVKPITEKMNLEGDEYYIRPTPIPGVSAGTTPHASALISRPGSYKRQTCAGGMDGGPATITIPAGRYGGESAGDADALAEAEFRATDTQAYANEHGTCSFSENYAWSGPAGTWHVRFSHPAQMAIYHNNGMGGPADMGNTQSLQGQGGSYIYLAQTNDLDFPTGDLNWLAYVFGDAFTNWRVKLYKNGALLWSRQVNINRDGFELVSLLLGENTTYPLVEGDRLFIKLESL